jgi:HEAT repeat protein
MCLLAVVCLLGANVPGGEQGKAKDEELSPDEMIARMAEDDWAGRHYHQKLARIGKPVMPQLVEALDHEVPRVRYWSVAALAKIGDPAAVDPILQRLQDPEPVVRSVATWHLHRWFEQGKVREAVFERLTDQSERVQTWAARAIKENWEMETVRDAVMERIDHENRKVRGWALDIIREKKYRKALPRLREFLGSDDLVRRYAAVRALPELAGEEAIPALTKALRRDSSPEVRAAAVHGLSRWFDRPEVRQLILDALREEDEFVRGWALNVVAEKGYKKALPQVRKLLQNEDPDVRYDAVRALARIQGPESLQTLMEVLQKDESAAVRECALRTVTFMRPRSPRTGELLIQGLKDSNEDVRAAAAELLRKGFDQFYGYRADETLGARQDAIDSWEQWYQRHKNQLSWNEEKERFDIAGEAE